EAETLKIVGRSARFPAHAAQKAHAAFVQRRRHLVNLLDTFDRARPADNCEVAVADLRAIRHSNHSALVRPLPLHAQFLTSLFFFQRHRRAEDFAEQGLDRLVAERPVVGLLQVVQHLGFALRVIKRRAHLLLYLADFRSQPCPPVQQIENLQINLVNLCSQALQITVSHYAVSPTNGKVSTWRWFRGRLYNRQAALATLSLVHYSRGGSSPISTSASGPVDRLPKLLRITPRSGGGPGGSTRPASNGPALISRFASLR